MTTNQTYLAIGVGVFVANVMYVQYQDARISSIEQEVQSIHTDVMDIKNIVLEKTNTKVKYSDKDVECLARNVYYEAGIESTAGKYAVAQVTLNRVKTGYWGKSICKVVYAKEQFSWTRVPKRAWVRLKGRAWDDSQAVAEATLAQGIRVKKLKTALFYHADYVKPNWRDQDKRVAKIGQHIFYTQAKGSTLKL
jgi:spore germination cell wall hydrolase CwlJ-like protein